MTIPHSMITGRDLAAGDDQTGQVLFLPHAHHPGCGFTILMDEQIALHRLGLLPVRCKSCGELMTDRGDV
jgi:hypothetical protein